MRKEWLLFLFWTYLHVSKEGHDVCDHKADSEQDARDPKVDEGSLGARHVQSRLGEELVGLVGLCEHVSSRRGAGRSEDSWRSEEEKCFKLTLTNGWQVIM